MSGTFSTECHERHRVSMPATQSQLCKYVLHYSRHFYYSSRTEIVALHMQLGTEYCGAQNRLIRLIGWIACLLRCYREECCRLSCYRAECRRIAPYRMQLRQLVPYRVRLCQITSHRVHCAGGRAWQAV